MKNNIDLSVVKASGTVGAGNLKTDQAGKKNKAPRPLPALVERIQQLAIEPLVLAMAKVHDQVDNSVFKLAEKARNNNEQSHYFDAMRKIRLNRELAENTFRQALQAIFKHFPGKHYQSFSATTGPVELSTETEPLLTCDEFSLVQNDELEETIALESMVGKARVRCKDLLYHLNMRLDSLVADEKVDESNNPLDPAQIAEAFMLASTGLDLDIKTKLLLYKQVDLIVMGELERVLLEANKCLIQEGVLPDLRRKIRKSKSVTRSPSSPQPLAATDGMDIQELGPKDFAEQVSGQIVADGVFDALVALLRESRLPGSVGGVHAAQSASLGPEVEADVLLDMLTNLQAEQLEDEPDWSEISNAECVENRRAFSSLNVTTVLLESLEKRLDGKASIGQSNEDVINLVALLFEFILDDYNLPVSIQALLARLQIPILKVALKDPAFFDQRNHPARKLLNELARACVGWDKNDLQKQDDLFEQVSGIVRRILNEFSGDIALFEDLYTQFKNYIERVNHRAQVMEKRTLERIYGQAKSQQVRNLVKEILKERLHNQELPAIVSKILLGGWSKVLYTECLSHGIESKECQRALTLADTLIWSVQTHIDDLDAHKKRIELLPELLQGLYEGLTAVGSNPFELSTQFSALERAHVAALKAELMHLQKIGDEQINEIKETEERVEAMVKQVRMGEELYVDPDSKGLPAINDEILDSLSESKSDQSESLFDEHETKEIIEAEVESSQLTAVEKQKRRFTKHESYMQQLDAVALGTWFEIKLPEMGKVRCKLAKKLTDIDLLVFVGRFGNKVLERTPRSFLEDLAKGKAKQLDDGSLFDRALGKVFQRLKTESEQVPETNHAHKAKRVQKNPEADTPVASQKTQVSKEIEGILAALAEE